MAAKGEIPDVLASSLDMLEAEVKTALPETVRTLRKNAPSHLGDINSWMKPDPAIERYLIECHQAVVNLCKVFDDFGIMAHLSDSKAAIDQARTLALISIDRVRDALVLAEPNDRAAALGVSW